MIRALKILLTITGTIYIVIGLATTVTPDQWAALVGVGEISVYERWLLSIFGVSLIAAGVWIIAAMRDPLRHINWVKFVILKSILTVLVGLYLIIQNYVDFSQVGPVIILDAVFAVAFLALYPWREARAN